MNLPLAQKKPAIKWRKSALQTKTLVFARVVFPAKRHNITRKGMTKKMKKIPAVICGLSLIFSLAACSSEASGSEPNSGIVLSNTITVPTPKPTLPPVPEAETDNSRYRIQILVGEQNFPTVLYRNETTDAIMEQLPMTLDMSDMNGNEKYYYFSDSLPTEAERSSEIHAGDLMLYGTDCMVLFYENFSSAYSYTTLGYVEDADGLVRALGSGNMQISFKAE